ncbi:MAG: ferritin-like domain-containing protein [Bacteroidetes bacterium]|nr:ferritin-like domain-containing protein [Bacteroidota bacterium]
MKVKEQKEEGVNHQPIDRLGFLKMSGVALASTALILTGCKKDEAAPVAPATPSNAIDLGSGDIGVLNYAFSLEQLEAAFYTQVMATPYSGMTAEETQILGDLKLHEVAHRDFLKAALGSSAIIALTFNFSSIDFSSRASVLATAKAFEDLGVSAYNGAGKLITDPNYLLIAGKIVSVEARHAAAIRDLLNPNSADFAGDDVVTVSQGLDVSRTPAQVLAIASPYITNQLDASNLPTS